MQRPSAGLSPRVSSPFSPSGPRPLPGLTVRLGAGLWGGRAAPQGVCVRVGSAAAAPGSPPGGSDGMWREPKPLSVPRPGGWKRRPPGDVPTRPNPLPGPRRGGGEGLVAGSARRPGEKPSAGPFLAPRPQCHHCHLTFLRTGFAIEPTPV